MQVQLSNAFIIKSAGNSRNYGDLIRPSYIINYNIPGSLKTLPTKNTQRACPRLSQNDKPMSKDNLFKV